MADLQSTIAIGETYQSFEELRNRVYDFGKSEYTLFVMGDCRKSKCHSNELEGPGYEYVTFNCKQGGKRRCSRSKGIRPNQSTLKCGCPVRVRAIASRNADGVLVYKITRAVLEHNHSTSEVLFRAYPENRRVDVTESVEALVKCPTVTNEDLRHHIQVSQQKTLFTSDVRNLKLRLSAKASSDHLQKNGVSTTSKCLQATSVEGLPGYNHSLPGKGKRKASPEQRWTFDVKGDLLFGLHPVYLALQAKRRKMFNCLHVHDKLAQPSVNTNPMVNEICQIASGANIPIRWVRKRDMDMLAGNRPHQGVCLDAEQLECPLWNETVAPNWCQEDPPLWLFPHNIQDTMNFGAILRSSYYMGVEKVIVPKDNSCKLSPVVSKSSSGVLEVVDVFRLPSDVIEEMFCQWWKSHGGMVLGTQSKADDDDGGDDNLDNGGDNDDKKSRVQCVALQDFTMTKPSLLILGNEGSGLSKSLMDLCDVRLYIESHQPGFHKEVDSLNVSVATGILLHWLQMSKLKKQH